MTDSTSTGDAGDHPDGQDSAAAGSTGSRIAVGAILNVVGIALIRGLGIVNLAVLGRLLSPADFGLMAMALVVVGFVEAVHNRQFEMALIRQPDRTSGHYDTAFGLGLLFGVLGAAAVALAARPVASFFNAPDLAAMLYALSAVPLLVGAVNPYFTAHEIALDFRPRVTRDVVGRTLLTVMSVAVALAVGNQWALVAGYLTMHVVFVAITWIYATGRPRPALPHWRAYLAFGGWLSLSGMCEFVARRAPVAVLGRLSTSGTTGLFQVGNELGTTLVIQFVTPLAQAIFPGLAAVSESRDRFAAAWISAQQGLLAFTLPVGVGVALVAPELVSLVLGSQWTDAVPVIRVLAPIAALTALIQGLRMAAMIENATRVLFLRNLIRVILVVPLSILGYHWAGLIGVVLAQAAVMLVDLALVLQLSRRLTGLPAIAVLRAGWRSYAATVLMTAAVLAVDRTGSTDAAAMTPLAAAGVLGLKAAVGAAVYTVAHVVLWVLAGRPAGIESRLQGYVAAYLPRRRG